MEELLTGNIWGQIARRVRQATHRQAAIAYVSNARSLRLAKGDVLICDASDQAIKSRATSAKALGTYLKAGVLLYNHPGLHAKVLVFGHHALIGSSNLSALSVTHLREAALLTTRMSARSQTLAFIHQVRQDAEEIDKRFIDRVGKIKLNKATLPGGSKRGKRTKVLGHRFWMVSTVPDKKETPAEEEALIAKGEKQAKALFADEDSELDSFRWHPHARFAKDAQPGDTVVQIHCPSKHRAAVWKPIAILSKQVTPQWVRFYFELPKDHIYVPWGQFERMLKKVGLRTIKKSSVRELSGRDSALVETIWSDIR
jgi:hypothetical protein